MNNSHFPSSLEVNSIDFSRSQLRFTTTRVNHTPRLSVDAVSTLTAPNAEQRRYYLTCACIGEGMYLHEGLIHEPVHEFNLIASPDHEFMMLKRFANAASDIRNALSVRDTMPTHDGVGAQVVELAVREVHYRSVSPIERYHEFREALLDGHLVNGRTTYTDEDGLLITLDYPARTINVAHEQEAWQVDAGPILMPLPISKRAHETQRLVEKLDIAYLVFNRFDYAEAVIRQPTTVNGSTSDSITNHYSLRHNLKCHNQLFVVN